MTPHKPALHFISFCFAHPFSLCFIFMVRLWWLAALVVLLTQAGGSRGEDSDDTLWDVLRDYIDDAWFLVCLATGGVILIIWIAVCCVVCRRKRHSENSGESSGSMELRNGPQPNPQNRLSLQL